MTRHIWEAKNVDILFLFHLFLDFSSRAIARDTFAEDSRVYTDRHIQYKRSNQWDLSQ